MKKWNKSLLQSFDDLEKDVLKNYNVVSSEEQIKNEEIQKEEDINNEVRVELEKDEKAEVVKEQEEEEKEETIKEKEVNLDDTIDFGINSIGKHDVKDQKDEIDEIKSFFASDDDDK